MTDRKAYSAILAELECIKHRTACDKDCTSCPFSYDLKVIEESFKYVKEVLKARDPQLYFSSDIELLKEIINNGN